MTTNLPSSINVADARLPQTYENAKTALANCERIDECQEWANKAEALASYAKMADDDALRKLADRIQARAVRRCGELLKQYQTGAKGGRPKKNSGDGSTVSQRSAADSAGLSKDQEVTAVRVSNVADADFDAAVESDNPPTVTALAEQGKKPRSPPPEGFAEASKLIGTVRRFAEFCDVHDPAIVANGVLSNETVKVRQLVSTIDSWLDRFVVNLEK